MIATSRLRVELEALQVADATDVVIYPASGGLERVGLLAEALQEAGFQPVRNHRRE